MNECKCGRPTRDAAYVCDDCSDSLARALAEVPAVATEIQVSITRESATKLEGSSPSTEKPLPYNEKAADSLRNLRAILVSWVRFCDEEDIRHQSPTTRLPKAEPAAMSRWLMWRIDGLSLHEIGAEAVDELTGAVTDCWHQIDRPAERQYVGPCGCGRDLYRKPGRPTVKCRWCGVVTEADALLEKLRAHVMGRLVTAHEGSALLGRFGLSTQQGTIDKWRERGRILEHSTDPKGRRLYLFDDLVAVAAHTTSVSA